MRIRQRLPGRKTLIAALVGLLAGLAVAGAAWWYTGRESTAQASTVPTTRSVAAAVDTIQQTISTSGTLTPAVQQDVSFVASGTVTSVNEAVGQQVTAGQPLATVDTLTMRQTLATAKLALAKAQATQATDQTALTTAQDAQSTAQDAGDDTTAADLKVSTAQQQLAVDQTSISSAQTSVDAAQTALDSATLASPIDGVVSAVNVAVGQKVTGSATSATDATAGSSGSGSAGSGSSGSGSAGSASGGSGSGSASSAGGGGTGGSAAGNSGSTSTGSASSGSGSSSGPAFVIVGTGSWKVDVTVDDAQIGLIAVGDQAQLAVTGSADPLFGTVSSIGLISTGSGGTASYPVVVTLTGTPTGLHDGTSATVTLIYAQFTNVLTVPSAAIHTVNGQSVVYTMSGDQQVSTPVEIGESDGTNTEITSGLSEGDQVLVTVTTGTGSGAGGAGRTGQTGGTGAGTGAGTGRGGFTGGFGGGGGGGGGFTGGAFATGGQPAAQGGG